MGIFSGPKTPKAPKLPDPLPEPAKPTDQAIIDVREAARRKAAANSFRPVINGELQDEPNKAKKMVLGY